MEKLNFSPEYESLLVSLPLIASTSAYRRYVKPLIREPRIIENERVKVEVQTLHNRFHNTWRAMKRLGYRILYLFYWKTQFRTGRQSRLGQNILEVSLILEVPPLIDLLLYVLPNFSHFSYFLSLFSQYSQSQSNEKSFCDLSKMAEGLETEWLLHIFEKKNIPSTECQLTANYGCKKSIFVQAFEIFWIIPISHEFICNILKIQNSNFSFF